MLAQHVHVPQTFFFFFFFLIEYQRLSNLIVSAVMSMVCCSYGDGDGGGYGHIAAAGRTNLWREDRYFVYMLDGMLERRGWCWGGN